MAACKLNTAIFARLSEACGPCAVLNQLAVILADDGPQSPAECSHVLCHMYGGVFLYNSCAWDGECTPRLFVDEPFVVMPPQRNRHLECC